MVDELQGRLPETRGLARKLLERGWLTPYQVNRIFQGRGRRAGARPVSCCWNGSARAASGQVFKARHHQA